MSAGGECEAAVTARTRCGLVKLRECGELLYCRRFPLKQKETVYKSYVRPVILCGSEAWCLMESEMGILRTERSMVKAMCGVQLNNRKRSKDLMLMLGLNVTIDQLAMSNSVRWHGDQLRREYGHVLRRALDFEVDGKRNKMRPRMTWMKQVEEESVKVGLRRENTFCR